MTPAELRTLDFVGDFIDRTAISPTCTEIARHLGVSPPRAWKLAQALVDQGALTKRPHGHRALGLPGAPDLRVVPTSRLQAELGRRGVTMNALAEPQLRDHSRHAVTCAVDFCPVPVRRGHLMCRRHWFAVPFDMREGIKQAFGAQDEQAYGDLVYQAREIAASATARAA
jgi:hypothetical protein